MHFINPADLPEGLIEAIQRQADAHMMQHEVEGHMVSQLLEDLDTEQLQALRLMLKYTEGDSAAYFQGRITQKLEDKHHVCSGCGHKHDDPGDFVGPEEPTGEPVTMPSEASQRRRDPEWVQQADLNKTWEIDTTELLEEYNLKVMHSIAGAETPPYLMCKGCETPYQSLADRMRQPPGVKGCSACQQKQKWG